jgi:hypothetical protein
MVILSLIKTLSECYLQGKSASKRIKMLKETRDPCLKLRKKRSMSKIKLNLLV